MSRGTCQSRELGGMGDNNESSLGHDALEGFVRDRSEGRSPMVSRLPGAQKKDLD